jgi:putative ABC transport system permease protein
MSGIGSDLKFAVRILRTRLTVSLAAVVALALGIAGATVVFSVIDVLLLHPWPAIPNSGKIVWFFETNGKLDTGREGVPPADYIDWKRQAQSFEDVATIGGATFNLADSGTPQRIDGSAVSPNFFRMLGNGMQIGTGFSSDELDTHEIVLSDRLWQRRYGGDRTIIGRDVTLDGVTYKIAGVTPPGFQYPKLAEFWVPSVLSPAERDNRQDAYLAVVGRVKAATTVEQAQAEMATVAERLGSQYPATNRGWTVTLARVDDMFVGPRRMPLVLVMAAVLLMLAIACSNVGNLLLSRAAERQREIGIRVALGSTPRRIIQQLFTEGLLIGAIAGVLGVLLAAWGLELLVASLPATSVQQLPRLQDVTLDRRALLFALLASIVVSIAFSLPAALRATRFDVFESLRSGDRSASSGRSRRLASKALVVLQIALALVLLVGGVLATRGYAAVAMSPLGFGADHVFTARMTLPSRYHDAAASRFVDRLADEMRGIPGVQSVAFASDLPLSERGGATDFVIEGQPPPSAAEAPFSLLTSASTEYFRTLAIPVVAGRAFTTEDVASSQRIVVVSAALARKYFPAGAVGHRLVFATGSPDGGLLTKAAHTIVGVVGDVKDPPNRGEHGQRIYIPLHQFPTNDLTVAMRTGIEPMRVAAAARAAVQRLDGSQALAHPMPLSQAVSQVYAPQRILVVIFGAVAMLSLLLAIVGVYALVGYLVTQRWRELGIRIALGLPPTRVVGFVMRDVVRLTLAGVLLGALGAFAAHRLATNLIPELDIAFLPTLTLPVVVLVLTAGLAAFVPARRAATVDPMAVLRSE